jgi:hypothetical protein
MAYERGLEIHIFKLNMPYFAYVCHFTRFLRSSLGQLYQLIYLLGFVDKLFSSNTGFVPKTPSRPSGTNYRNAKSCLPAFARNAVFTSAT